MPRIKTILCSGICLIYVTAITGQVTQKNKPASNFVSYQVHQQKQWNYNQLPKNSIQYRSDPKYIPLVDKKTSTTRLHLYPIATPEVKKSFFVATSASHNNSRSYLQSSRFLKYEWQRQSLQNRLGHSL
jgi:hypothetical protein